MDVYIDAYTDSYAIALQASSTPSASGAASSTPTVAAAATSTVTAT